MIDGKTGSFPLDDDEDGGKEYRKIATIWAKQIDREFIVDSEEGQMKGLPGDYLVQGADGRAWPLRRSFFETDYEEIQ